MAGGRGGEVVVVGGSGRARRARRDRDLVVGLAAALAAGLLTLAVGLSGAVAAPWPTAVSVWGTGVCALILFAVTVVAVISDPGAARPGGRGACAAPAGVVLVAVSGLWLCVVLGGVAAVGEPGALLFGVLAVATTIGFEVRLLRARTRVRAVGDRTAGSGAGGRR